ncbi:MAG: hypothetical protein KDJ35_09330 [Alphaproteobacteria bacterium]|nr:hypothetical protein [Alphaproteobacteria bacterium]
MSIGLAKKFFDAHDADFGFYFNEKNQYDPGTKDYFYKDVNDKSDLFEDAVKEAGFKIQEWPNAPESEGSTYAKSFTDYHARFDQVAKELAKVSGVKYQYYWTVSLQHLFTTSKQELVPLQP